MTEIKENLYALLHNLFLEPLSFKNRLCSNTVTIKCQSTDPFFFGYTYKLLYEDNAIIIQKQHTINWSKVAQP